MRIKGRHNVGGKRRSHRLNKKYHTWFKACVAMLIYELAHDKKVQRLFINITNHKDYDVTRLWGKHGKSAEGSLAERYKK